MGKRTTKAAASSEATEALDRRYVNAYRRRPEKSGWGRISAKLLARQLRDNV